MSLVQDMKKQIASSGSSKSKVFYVPADSKKRIRFLQELDDGITLQFHDSFAKGVNAMCQEEIGKECPFCDDKDLRTRDLYGFLIYDYDSKEVKVFLYAANNFTPLPHFVAFSESYGSLMDRDYVIDRKGKQKNTVYSVIPQDKAKFRQKVKLPSKKQILKIVNQAFPFEGDDQTPMKDSPVKDVEDDDIEDNNYEDMTAKELYKECKSREIECEVKKKAKYYIELLEADDETEDWDEDGEEDWDDGDDEDDDWS